MRSIGITHRFASFQKVFSSGTDVQARVVNIVENKFCLQVLQLFLQYAFVLHFVLHLVFREDQRFCY